MISPKSPQWEIASRLRPWEEIRVQHWRKTQQLRPRRRGDTGRDTLRFVRGSEPDQPLKNSALDSSSVHKHSLVQGEEIL